MLCGYVWMMPGQESSRSKPGVLSTSWVTLGKLLKLSEPTLYVSKLRTHVAIVVVAKLWPTFL